MTAEARDPRQPDNIDVEVGRRVRVERIARGLSQTDLAKHIGVTFQQVQKYESGANRISIGRLTRIAQLSVLA
jgi:transcriptional regulator with XRE-family HTH domain